MGRKALDVGPLSLRVARILQTRKDELGLSDYALAELSGVPRLRLRRAITGERPFLVDDLEATALALGLVPWHVMREAEGGVPAVDAIDVGDRDLAQADDTRDDYGQEDYGLAAQIVDYDIEIDNSLEWSAP